jgi:carbamoyl-phosphate synthase small subunit
MQSKTLDRDTRLYESSKYARYGSLMLKDGTVFEGRSFGYEGASAGEVVFCTGMVGYPEALTDPSFAGQILTMTYPLVGNYGVPEPSFWESERVQVAGLIVSDYVDTPFHAQSAMKLGTWLRQEHIPALEIKDTRLLTQHIRTHGAMPGKIIFDDDIPWRDPNTENLVAQVSTRRIQRQGNGDLTIALIDCGMKRNIAHSLLSRNAQVMTVPWDYDLFAPETRFTFDGIVISNGPGDPRMAQETITTIRQAMQRRVPMLGICLGHQLLALAAGGETRKMKFGHRSQNQPCLLHDTKRCYITTQNHGFAVETLPPDFTPWFTNANDSSNEGMHHRALPFYSVQFHPEATPGPVDTDWIFDYFLERIRERREHAA